MANKRTPYPSVRYHKDGKRQRIVKDLAEDQALGKDWGKVPPGGVRFPDRALEDVTTGEVINDAAEDVASAPGPEGETTEEQTPGRRFGRSRAQG